LVKHEKEAKEIEEKIREELEEQEKEKKESGEETLPYCTSAPSAEHARANHDDESCDDGRSGGSI